MVKVVTDTAQWVCAHIQSADSAFYSRAESPSPLSMAVQLGHDDRGNVDLLLEGPGLRLTRLTYGGVHHKDNVVWFLEGGEGGEGRGEGGEGGRGGGIE